MLFVLLWVLQDFRASSFLPPSYANTRWMLPSTPVDLVLVCVCVLVYSCRVGAAEGAFAFGGDG